MISVVLYGRNDNYGYNLHKRAALSLNCMAEVLTDPSDEIIFVDYNTPDDFPTFPEAIQDTLTKRAREMLRILRIRPRIHERFKSRTRLQALEPIARNVGRATLLSFESMDLVNEHRHDFCSAEPQFPLENRSRPGGGFLPRAKNRNSGNALGKF